MLLLLYLSWISSDYNEIWCADANFGSKKGHVTKYHIFAKSNGRRPPYWKSFYAYISRFIVRLTQNLVWGSIIKFRHRSHYQNIKFRKFKMVDGYHFENGFIAISQQSIIWCQGHLLRRCRFSFSERLHDKVSKFCKFKMADGQHICENLFGYISMIYCTPNVKFGMMKHVRI